MERIQKVGEALIRKNLTIASAESCTGGLVAAAITDVPGISAVFSEGFVTYANQAKMKHLSVSEETLAVYGAVSEQTAKEMAEGVRRRTGSDIGVSTTGIAGPGGGTKEKPVGLVYIGVSTKDGTAVEELHLSGSREEIRKQTVLRLFELLYRTIGE